MFSADDLFRHSRFHTTLRLDALHSYEGAGAYSVVVSAAAAPSLDAPVGQQEGYRCDVTSDAARVLATAHVDCLWELRQSTIQTTDLVFPRAPDGSCLHVRVTTEDTVPARIKSEVKLLAVTLF